MHAGTINLRYLAPPLAVTAMGLGTLAGLAGLALLAAGTGGWPSFLLLAGFAAPLLYLLGLLAVTGTAAKSVRGWALAMLPVVLATMHIAWGIGFLTSPRRLVPQARPGA